MRRSGYKRIRLKNQMPRIATECCDHFEMARDSELVANHWQVPRADVIDAVMNKLTRQVRRLEASQSLRRDGFGRPVAVKPIVREMRSAAKFDKEAA